VRYQHASEMRADLARARRDTGSGSSSKSIAVATVKPIPRRLWMWGVSVATLLVVIGIVAWRWRGTPAPEANKTAGTLPSIAILPFQNLGGKEEDFLQMALPDEVATTLSGVRTLSIRPFASTLKFAKSDVDLQQAGKQMHVARIVTGHYQKVRDQLQLTLEAVDVGEDRVLWQETMNVPSEDLVVMREQVTAKVRQGLIPALGATNVGESGTRPKSEEAYDLYLRSVAMAHDGAQNTEAIRMLERSVGLDATFAPAWAALGKRYYYEEEYGPGANGKMTRTEPALRRALALDPDLEDAEQQIVSMDTDSGKLAQAYQEAKAMEERHPQSGVAHFTLSYILRYGSLSKEAKQECDTAVRFDPGNYQFRSCATLFMWNGQFDRGMEFAQLDAGSEWSKNVEVNFLLRAGKTSAALEELHKLPDSTFFATRGVEACYTQPRPANFAQIMEQSEKAIFAFRDPEPKYNFAAVYNICLGNGFTARLAKAAIEGGFCSYDYLEQDPLLAEFRKSREYAAVLEQAKQCRDRFLEERDRPATTELKERRFQSNQFQLFASNRLI